MGIALMMVEWKYAIMGSGAQSVMTLGTRLLLQ